MFVSACKEQVIHNLSESEAHRVMARLRDAQITAEKVKQPDLKWAVAVDSDQALEAIATVNQMRLQRDQDPKLQQKASFVSSPEEQRFGYELNVARELKATLESISGVLEARVHLNLPPSDPLLGVRSQTSGSASVLLVVDAGTEIIKEEIASLVAGASGVAAAQVAVLVKSATQDIKIIAPAKIQESINQPEAVKAQVHFTYSRLLLFAAIFGVLIVVVVLRAISAARRRQRISRMVVANDA